MRAKFFQLIKLLFSRVFLVALTVLIEVVLVLYFVFKLNEKYVYFEIGSSIIGILLFVTLINKKMNPEHKIIWACLFVMFPIFGIVLFILFTLNSPSKRLLNKYTKFDKKEFKKDELYKQQVYEIANNYKGQVKYIENMSGLNAYKNTTTTYLKDGKEFYDSLIADLNKAKKFIFLEYFIINNGSMWSSILQVLEKKVKEGVEVRVLYDDFGCAKYQKYSFSKKLRDKGIACHKFNRMIPLVSSIHNNRSHRKITIIDGYIAYTGGINISDEYMNINSPFGYWKDNAVKLYGEACDNLTVLFLQNFALATGKIQDFDKYLYKNNEHPEIISNEIIVPFGSGPSLRYYENISTDVFLHLINQAKISIDISTPYLVIDYSLSSALIAAVARGVKVRLLIPSKPDKKFVYEFTKLNAYELASHGVEIYTFTPGFNHAKSFLVDDEIAYVGTTNLDFRSLIHHYECGVLIYNSECMRDIDANFESDYVKSKLVTPNDLKSNFIIRFFISLCRIFQSLL